MLNIDDLKMIQAIVYIQMRKTKLFSEVERIIELENKLEKMINLMEKKNVPDK
jgi:hypothetical protein